MPRLKRAQYWVLDNILAKAPLHPAAHGFNTGRSIVSNATPHIGRAVVINVDLKEFFPSIALPRVKGVFKTLGYSEQVATVLALLSTESTTETVLVDGETFHVAHGPRTLPQGRPAVRRSPISCAGASMRACRAQRRSWVSAIRAMPTT